MSSERAHAYKANPSIPATVFTSHRTYLDERRRREKRIAPRRLSHLEEILRMRDDRGSRVLRGIHSY